MNEDKNIERTNLIWKCVHFSKGHAWELTALRYGNISLEKAKEFVWKFYENTQELSLEFLEEYWRILETFLNLEREDPKKADELIQRTKEEVIAKALEEKGEEWVVAALVDGSIGYHTPNHARILIKKFKEGVKEDYCERCLALYKGDLVTMMFWDIFRFERIEKKDPKKVSRIIDFVKKVSKLDSEKQCEIGLLYPAIPI